MATTVGKGVRAAWMVVLLVSGCESDEDFASTGSAVSATAAVLTEHNNNARTGAQLSETILNSSDVNAARFGKLFTRAVDGQLYAQPLYVADVDVPGRGRHNVVYAATEHNTVYAFDADDPSAAAPLWSVNLGPSVPAADVNCGDLAPEIGVTSTPVIDLATSTIYVVAKTKEGAGYFYRLHALDLATGAEKLGGPVIIDGSVAGTGVGQSGGRVAFSSRMQLNRPGLLLTGGAIYVASGRSATAVPITGGCSRTARRRWRRWPFSTTRPTERRVGSGATPWRRGTPATSTSRRGTATSTPTPAVGATSRAARCGSTRRRSRWSTGSRHSIRPSSPPATRTSARRGRS
jgi:hypothetical protein